MAKVKNEKELLENYLAKELDKRNIFNIHGNPNGIKGFPDRIVYGAKIYYFETKLGKENKSYYKQTPMQKKWEQQINQTCDEYHMIYSRKEIDEWVEKIYQECKEHNIKNFFAYNKTIK